MIIKSIHQIEITSRCNLRCVYCTHPKMQRPKIDMNLETYEKLIDLVKYFVIDGSQSELNLAGIGESTLHPDLENYISIARKALGNRIKLVMATNGIEVSKRPELGNMFKEYGVDVHVSLHRPEKAGKAIEILKKVGVLTAVSADPSVQAVDWAGQVDWHVSTSLAGSKCAWLHKGMAFAMSDGRITKCGFDANAKGVICHVDDFKPGVTGTAPFSLCNDCHFDPGNKIPVTEVA